MRDQFDSTFSGKNSSRTVVLEEGMKWSPTQFTSVDSQFHELRKYQFSEIARIFRVPAILLQDLEKASLNNTEVLGRQFLSYTLQPWLRNWEQAISMTLLTPLERKQYYPQFDLNDFTKADTQARWQSYVAAVTNGLMSPNEVRGFENMPPYEDGDDFHRPLNTGKAAGTPATQGALAHVVAPTNPMQSRARELERYLGSGRGATQLRLTRPRAETITIHQPEKDLPHA